MADGLNKRAKNLLTLLVKQYIRKGMPISSKTLAQDESIALSSATVRNVMAELEEKGYLTSPHTSAGRVPTVQAYRIFVDSLLTMNCESEANLTKTYRKMLDPGQTSTNLAANASKLLSELSCFAGLVTLPKPACFVLRHLEFLSLSRRRVLAILVLNEKEVQNRIIRTSRDYSASELEQAANYINSTFTGIGLAEIRRTIIHTLAQEQKQLNQLLQSTMDIVKGVFQAEKDDQDYVLSGEENLLDQAMQTDLNQLRDLFNTFARKRDILRLLDQCIQAEGIKIFIGDESGHQALHGCSLVTAPYSYDNAVIGVLGVIGPTRMPYDRVISIVNVTAKLLSEALKH